MKKEIILGIYKITSPSGKIYIGYTTNKTKRWNTYLKLNCKSQEYLYRSLKKHGVENHKFEMIHVFDKGELIKSEIIKELKKLEIHYIDFYKSFCDDSEFGLNLTRGGDGGEMSKEAREKIRKSKLGKKQSADHIRKSAEARRGQERSEEANELQRKKMTGRKNTAQHIKNQSEAKKGDKNPMFGKSPSEDSKNKRLKKILGRKNTPDTILKMKKAHSNRSEKTRRNISEAKKGDKNPMFGKKQSADHIAKRIATMKRNKELKRLAEKKLIEEEFLLLDIAS